MAWFERGESAASRDKDRDKKAANSRKRKGISEYRLDPKKQGKYILLDDALIFFYRHNGKSGKQYWSVTCKGEDSDCRGCSEEIPYTNVYCVGTILNMTGFVNNEGKRFRYFKQLLILKMEGKAEMLHQRERYKKRKGKEATLAMTEWTSRRGPDERSEKTGTHFEYVKKWTKKKLKAYLESKGVQRDDWKEFLSPVDYDEVLAPPTDAEWDKLLGTSGKSVIDDDEDDSWDDDDDEVEEEEEEKPKKAKKKAKKGSTAKDFVDLDDDDTSIEDLVDL